MHQSQYLISHGETYEEASFPIQISLNAPIYQYLNLSMPQLKRKEPLVCPSPRPPPLLRRLLSQSIQLVVYVALRYTALTFICPITLPLIPSLMEPEFISIH